MKKVILFWLFTLLPLLSVAQPKNPVFTLFVGQEYVWDTGAEVTSVTLGSNNGVVSTTHKGSKVTIKGLKRGLVSVNAKLKDGKTKKCTVRVKLADNVSTTPGTGWTGHYELKMPTDNWHIAYKTFSEGRIDRAGRIGHLYCRVDDLGPEKGLIYHRFNENTRRGYEACGNDPKFRHTDDAGDEGSEDYYFREFAPKPFDTEAFLHGAGILAMFGYVAKSGYGNGGDILQTYYTYNMDYNKELPKYYAGEETVCGVKCWKFDYRKHSLNGSPGSCYWIDPANGLCLKELREDGMGFEVLIYDLDYHSWTPDLFPEMK